MSEKPIKAAVETVDINGMQVVVGEPPFDVEADFELLLGEQADNQAWLRKQYPYLWVRSIDGEEVWPIEHYSEYRILRRRLDRDGYTRLVETIGKLLKGREDKVKNSPGTPDSDSAAA